LQQPVDCEEHGEKVNCNIHGLLVSEKSETKRKLNCHDINSLRGSNYWIE